MAEPAERRMTVDEFLAWDDGTPTRYELIDGAPVAMAPGMSFHGLVVVSAAVEIDRRLASRPPCRAQTEAGIRLSDTDYYVADIAATCAERRNEAAVSSPLLVVEVLSPSTRAHVVARKLPDYKLLPSVMEIWLLDSERRWAQIWWREAEGWHGRDFVGSAGFPSAALDDRIELDRLYRNTTL
jgi:Uma2 family endonuclease